MKQAFNPFLPFDNCIPDGEPHVFGDRIYLYGSHDKPCGETFCELDYEVWSAPVNDLTDWSSHGTVYSAKQDPLYSEDKKYLFAPDCVRGNDGRYYLYYALAGWRGKGGYDGPISVAVSDLPKARLNITVAFIMQTAHLLTTRFFSIPLSSMTTARFASISGRAIFWTRD